MKILIFLFMLVFSNLLYSQVTQQWAARYNAFTGSNESIFDILVDGSGNTYACGSSDSVSTMSDAIILKYNSSGTLLWGSRYNGTANAYDAAYSITADNSGNIYYTGLSQGSSTGFDLIIVKLSSAGVQQWAVRINGTANQNDFGSSIAIDNSGNVFCAGIVNRVSSNEDLAVVKLNSSGTQQWIEYYNWVNGLDGAQKIMLDASGNVYVSGRSLNASNNYDVVTLKYNNSGVNQYAARFNGISNKDDYFNNMDIDASGNVYVCGTSSTVSSGNEGVLIKYSNSGTEQWVTKYNYSGAFDDGFEDVKTDNNGNVFVCGFSESNTNVSNYTTIKYTSGGAVSWVQRYSGPVASSDGARSIFLDNSQNVYITGSGFGLNTDFDIVTIKYTNAGSQLWDQRYNFAGGQDVGIKAIGDNSGNIYIAGNSYSPSNPDMVIIKYSQPLGIQPLTGNIPQDYSLSQNYPNPFNPATKIDFNLPESGFTSISVFDVTGKLVQKLVNENLPAGKFSLDFNAEGLTSGIYFYRLNSGSFTETKKMILTK